MMPATHVLAAVGSAGWLLGPNPVGLVVAVAGAALPDVDELQSMMGYRLSVACGSLPLGIGRQRTHSVFALVLTSVGVGVLVGSGDLGVYFAMGWMSHLILDLFTGGVPLWWPWRRGPEHRVTLGHHHPGGAVDWILCTALSMWVVTMMLEDRWIPVWAEQVRSAVAATGGG